MRFTHAPEKAATLSSSRAEAYLDATDEAGTLLETNRSVALPGGSLTVRRGPRGAVGMFGELPRRQSLAGRFPRERVAARRDDLYCGPKMTE